MSPDERLVALMKGEPLDRVPFMPFILGFSARNVGLSLRDFYADPDKSYKASLQTQQQYCCDNRPAFGYADYGAWEFGGEAKFPGSPNEQSIMVTRRPVITEEEAWELSLPDIRTAGYLPTQMAFTKVQVKYTGRASTPSMTPFCTAVSLVGEEIFCRWMLTKPELCHHLLRLLTEHRKQVIQHWADTFGIENLRVEQSTGPESNDVISPQQFEEFALPYMLELHDWILSLVIRSIYCHICGDHTLNLPQWEKVPFGDPGMMTFGNQVDLDEAIQRFGEKAIIFGNLEPALILHGPPEKIFDETRKCLDKGKRAPRGYVLMSGCEVPVDTPPFHMWVINKAISDFGWYD
jgi:uroporphyrinogen decarboxylase